MLPVQRQLLALVQEKGRGPRENQKNHEKQREAKKQPKGKGKYHPFQNHYTHKSIIFKLFRSLQLQFSGPTGINFCYSYSFVGLTGICLYSYCSVQLHKKWSVELFSENYSCSYKKNGFRIKYVMISKRMVK